MNNTQKAIELAKKNELYKKWCDFNQKKLQGFIKSPTRMNLIFDFFTNLLKDHE